MTGNGELDDPKLLRFYDSSEERCGVTPVYNQRLDGVMGKMSIASLFLYLTIKYVPIQQVLSLWRTLGIIGNQITPRVAQNE